MFLIVPSAFYPTAAFQNKRKRQKNNTTTPFLLTDFVFLIRDFNIRYPYKIGTYPMQPMMNLSISAHKFAKTPEQKSTNSLKYARKCFASSAEMRKFAP